MFYARESIDKCLTIAFSQYGSSISVFPHHFKSWGFPLWKPTGLSSCTLNYPPSLGSFFLNILGPAEVQALNDKLKKQQIKWEIFILRSNHKEGGWRGPWAWELLVALPLQNLLFSNHQIKQKAKDGQIALGTFKLLKFPFYLSGKPTLNYVYQYIRLVSDSAEHSVNSDISVFLALLSSLELIMSVSGTLISFDEFEKNIQKCAFLLVWTRKANFLLLFSSNKFT